MGELLSTRHFLANLDAVVNSYYNGFEGEPAIIFKRGTNNSSDQLKLWEGYFDELISFFQPNPEGRWEGLLENYHLHTGWYEEEDWKVQDVKGTIKLFKELIIPSERHEILNIRNAIVKFLEQADKINSQVSIAYD